MVFFGKNITNVTLKQTRCAVLQFSWNSTAPIKASKRLDSKTHINQLFTILSIVLHKQRVGTIAVALKCGQGHWKWYEQAKLNV